MRFITPFPVQNIICLPTSCRTLILKQKCAEKITSKTISKYAHLKHKNHYIFQILNCISNIFSEKQIWKISVSPVEIYMCDYGGWHPSLNSHCWSQRHNWLPNPTVCSTKSRRCSPAFCRHTDCGLSQMVHRGWFPRVRMRRSQLLPACEGASLFWVTLGIGGRVCSGNLTSSPTQRQLSHVISYAYIFQTTKLTRCKVILAPSF